jgi:hypothetical protein
MFPPEAHEATIAEAAKQLLSKSAAIAESAGVLCDTVHASDVHPYKAIPPQQIGQRSILGNRWVDSLFRVPATRLGPSFA